MERIKKDILTVTVYYYEDPDGYIVLDEDMMIREFHRKLENLYESTKLGKQSYYNDKYNQKEEKWKKKSHKQDNDEL